MPLFPFNRSARLRRGYGSFLIRYKGSTDYGWLSLSYRMLYDDIGHATKAVGLAKPLSDTFSRQSSGSIPQQFLPSALLSNLLIRARMNLTENRIEEVWREGKDLSQKYVNCDCNRILKLIIRDIAQPESLLMDADMLTPDALIKRYHESERWIAFDSLKADCGGNIRHVRHIIHMLSGNASDEIWLNAYLLQVNIPQEAEKLFPESAFRDSSSMVYERAAIDNIAQRLCRKYAVAIFQVNGFASCEPEMKKRTMTSIAIAVQAALGCECLTGHYQDDSYIILLSAKLTAENLKKEFEEAFTLIRRTADDARLMSQLHFSVGIATPDTPDTQYQTLVRKAEDAILQRRNILIDSILFADQPEDRSMESLQTRFLDDNVSILSMSGALPPLEEDEKEVVFNCMSIMLSAPNSEASVLGVLKTIGLYCSADRVYILSLTRNMDVVTMPYEWDDPCKYMLQQIVSGMKVSSIPIVKRCIAERAPVFLTRNQPESVTGNGITHGPWKFSIFPFLEDNEIHGFLCIENARRRRIGRKEITFGLCLGIPNYLSSLFLLKSLSAVSAYIAYPTYSVGAILVVTAVSCLIFKEKLTGWSMARVAIIIPAVILLNS